MKKVLIIDDEEDICLLLKHYLSKNALDVYYENTLTEGLEAISRVKPSVILLDNNLPDGLGINHISEIKEGNPDTKLYMISAYSSLKDQATQFGADSFISKPFELSTIMSLMN
ncbi:response regulator [Jiulongibacter sp. NS-SX5]|uniref:response regulator n=1 Tax=Jiulongibacter sp. NS-SX5 TaxID=3463854 RepID=UPI00405A24C1